ncbi:MAG: sigma-E factor regulatory protein RseB domain-containing protein [Mycobacteriales bacterium]
MRRVLLVATGGLTCALAGSALGLPLGQTTARTGPDGWTLLDGASRASDALRYQGTQFVVLWSPDGATSALVDISHEPGRGSVLRVAATPQSPATAVFESDDTAGVANVARVSASTVDLLRRNYDVTVDGAEHVAGRVATVVVVRRDDGTAAARFWIDRATNLVLRREVLDDQGRTVQASAFLQVDLGRAAMPTYGAVPRTTIPGEALDDNALSTARAAGWAAPTTLPNGLELFDARRRAGEPGDVLHLSYSDGVSHVSVFEQRGRLDTSALDGWHRERVAGTRVWVNDAFPRRVVWAANGRVFTVVAECERTSLEALVAALPHRGARRPLLSRLTRGLRRVGSWINPFS